MLGMSGGQTFLLLVVVVFAATILIAHVAAVWGNVRIERERTRQARAQAAELTEATKPVQTWVIGPPKK